MGKHCSLAALDAKALAHFDNRTTITGRSGAAANAATLRQTDDDAVVGATINGIKEALCGPEDSLGPEHRCDPPWFIVSTSMRKQKAKRWRKLLNR